MQVLNGKRFVGIGLVRNGKRFIERERQQEAKARELVGLKIGRLKVIGTTVVLEKRKNATGQVGRRTTGRRALCCLCDCGELCIKPVSAVKKGDMSSCGQCGYRERKLITKGTILTAEEIPIDLAEAIFLKNRILKHCRDKIRNCG